MDGTTKNQLEIRVVDKSLNNGYEGIKSVFSKSGDSIGGLVNPDIQVERLAMIKEALTLPASVNRDNAGRGRRGKKLLKTADILKGASAEILNGVDLKQILASVLDAEETPQFLLNKITSTIDNVADFTAKFTTPTVKKTLSLIVDASNRINALTLAVQQIQAQYDSLSQRLNDLRSQLNVSFPTLNNCDRLPSCL
jgi:hypothetical protein